MKDELRWVSQGFGRKVKMYEKYDVNGYRFHTESHQNNRPNAKTINTGVFTGEPIMLSTTEGYKTYTSCHSIVGPNISLSLCSDAIGSTQTVD